LAWPLALEPNVAATTAERFRANSSAPRLSDRVSHLIHFI
jgi:hypothetical protein